jgi:hypothetical protein
LGPRLFFDLRHARVVSRNLENSTRRNAKVVYVNSVTEPFLFPPKKDLLPATNFIFRPFSWETEKRD